MALIQKSIKISREDIEFCLSKGRNLSDGIRYCICQTRTKKEFVTEIKKLLSFARSAEEEKEILLSTEQKNKLLKLIDM